MFVKKVEYFEEYKLKVLFNDGKIKIVDIKSIIINSKRAFKPLMDIEYFKKVSLDNDECPLGIRWPNDADICPDYLYEIGVDFEEQKKPAQKIHRNYVGASRLSQKRKSVAKIKQKIS